MAIPANYFDQGPEGQPSQFQKDSTELRLLQNQFHNIGMDVTRQFVDGSGLSAAQKTALRTYYAGWLVRLDALRARLPT